MKIVNLCLQHSDQFVTFEILLLLGVIYISLCLPIIYWVCFLHFKHYVFGFVYLNKMYIQHQSCTKYTSLHDLTTSCYCFNFKFPIFGTGSWISTNNFIFINCVFSLNTTSSMLLHSSPPRSKEPSMSSRKTSKTSLDNVETISSGGGEYTNSAGGSLSWRQNDTSRLSENCSEEQSSQYCQECDL